MNSVFKDHPQAEMLQDAHDAITHCGLWDWIKSFEPETGFMFAKTPELDRINAAMKYDGHSGASYGWTMRQMQQFARLRPTACPCRSAKGFTDGWCGVAGGGVPACDH